MRRRFLWIVGMAVVAAGLLGARRTGVEPTGVAPWDVPDAPNPTPGPPPDAPPMGDPAGLIHASGTKAVLLDGTTVQMTSVGRRRQDPSGENPLDAQPIWTPDGAPLHGRRDFGGGESFRPAIALEGKGARYLTFRLSGPNRDPRGEEATATGYVPDGARLGTPRPELHGWDVTDRAWIGAQDPSPYRTCVVVDDRRASRYRFALARGDWKVVRSVPIVATDVSDALLAQGSWGKLRRVAPPKEQPGRAYWRRTMQTATFVVDPPAEPSAFAYQVRVLDADGRPNAAVGPWATQPSSGDSRVRWPRAVRVEVATRPYEWVEFSNVHYDPDPAKWAKAYWGEEGEKTIPRAGGTSLQALIRPLPNEFHGWDPGEVYAPDGRLWRAHPSPAALSPSFSGDADYSGRLVAGFELESGRVARDRPARIEAFASQGSIPGKGLGASLSRSAWSTDRFDQMMFPVPKTPYVQFAVRYASEGWSKVGEIAIPRFAVPSIKPEERAGYEAHGSDFTVFSVILRSKGVADLYWHTRGQSPGFPARSIGIGS